MLTVLPSSTLFLLECAGAHHRQSILSRIQRLPRRRCCQRLLFQISQTKATARQSIQNNHHSSYWF